MNKIRAQFKKALMGVEISVGDLLRCTLNNTGTIFHNDQRNLSRSAQISAG